MSWFSRLLGREEKRALTRANTPFNIDSLNEPDVNLTQALSLVPVWSCVRLLSDTVASLPLKSYRKLPDGSRQTINPPRLIASPSSVVNLQKWIHQAMMSLLLRGNAYGLVINRDALGFPTQIEWLNPDEVQVDESRPSLPVYRWHGKVVPTGDMVHISWMSLPGSVVGMSPITAFAKTIGVGLSATNYGADWFGNGGTPPATFQNTQTTVSPEEANEIRERTVAAMRTRKPLVFGNDWVFEALSVNPNESQFVQTLRLNATHIAAIFGVPPEMVGGETGKSMTYQSVEQQQINFVQMTLRPWLVLLENVISGLLPDRQYVRFNVDAIIRTDIKTRYESYQIAHNIGLQTVDEQRALEDLPPLTAVQKVQLRPAVPILNGNGVPASLNGSSK